MLSMVVSTICAAVFTGSAMPTSRVVAPRMPSVNPQTTKSALAYDLSESFSAYHGILEDQSEHQIKNFYGCEVCGGMADGCPMCQTPSPAAVYDFDLAS